MSVVQVLTASLGWEEFGKLQRALVGDCVWFSCMPALALLAAAFLAMQPMAVLCVLGVFGVQKDGFRAQSEKDVLGHLHAGGGSHSLMGS